MSNNKYIIDKDSLTGIADVVRNKLGTGEATTDSQTGDIIYPEDKGYYLKQGKLAGFIYPNTSSSHYTSSELISVSHATILELCGGINPSFIKFTVLTKGDSNSSYQTASQTLYNGVYFYSGEITNSATLLNNVVGATKTFAYTGQGCYITGASGSQSTGGWNPNYYSFYSFPGVLQIEFLNENQQNIEAAIDGPIAGTSRYTMEIPNGEVSTKIPFSIDDIQNKITNYLIASKDVGNKTHFLYHFQHNNVQYGTPLSEMNLLNHGVTNLSQLKFLWCANNSTSWYPGTQTGGMWILDRYFIRGNSSNYTNPYATISNGKFTLCPSVTEDWPLGVWLGGVGDMNLSKPTMAFIVYQEATE